MQLIPCKKCNIIQSLWFFRFKCWFKVQIISRIHLRQPNAYKLLCFDRNINGIRDVKFFEWDYWSLDWRKNLTLAGLNMKKIFSHTISTGVFGLLGKVAYRKQRHRQSSKSRIASTKVGYLSRTIWSKEYLKWKSRWELY